MKDLQFNQSIPTEIWETLHATDIRVEDFSARTYSAIRRAGYDTMGELADSTEHELREALQKVKRIEVYGLEKVVKAVLDKFAEMGFRLPTDEEKQGILNALTETEQLQREINLLSQKLEELQKENESLERQVRSCWEIKNDNTDKAIDEAKEIAAGENAVPKIIDRMQFVGTDGGRVHFCNIFLREKYCVLDNGSSYPFEKEDMNTICQKCIDKFLRKYYQA